MSARDRLVDLKAKRLACVKKNRRDVYNEAKEAGNGGSDRSDEEQEEKDQSLSTKGNAVNKDQLNVLSYTASEDALWTEKQTARKGGVNVDTINDFKKLAERTYKKQIEEFKTQSDSEFQEQKKRKYIELKDQGYSDVHIRTILTDPASVKRESTRVKAFEARVYKKRAAKQKSAMKDHGIAINERNRAFNEKLKRELKAQEDQG